MQDVRSSISVPMRWGRWEHWNMWPLGNRRRKDGWTAAMEAGVGVDAIEVEMLGLVKESELKTLVTSS